MRVSLSLAVLLLVTVINASDSPPGFFDIPWGTSIESTRLLSGGAGWAIDGNEIEFPPELNIQVYKTNNTIAGYNATVRYYFWENSLFQTTVMFDFEKLVTYDFNYNVYRSVSEYYSYIRSYTLLFVLDVYNLLSKKYGKKEPIFKGLDPRYAFVRLDALVKQERWNYRYHPFDFYQMIVTSSYAQWDFPHTRIIFSVNISAPDKRFEYTLCAASLDMVKMVTMKRDKLRMSGL